MKPKALISGIASLAILFGAADAVAQIPVGNGGNPGIAISGSANYAQLPKKAQAFIEKHFKDAGVMKCEKYFAKGKYEVELRNGVDLEFNTKGDLIEVDAPDNTVLPIAVVKDVMPRKAYGRLEKDGLAGMVETIELNRGKVYEVDLNIAGPDTYVFDVDGVFLAIED
ncbi:PepSY-like domain-containing protein [Duncaniella dubosii]|uniref:PepSY-like domain-containing protein n=1 Tax=Duncaniella dubosii TaxID=2518971 RepID=UPI0025A9EEF8|nr:PepSY-like domain-containing protein [uncultured Duncaniella sp.]